MANTSSRVYKRRPKETIKSKFVQVSMTPVEFQALQEVCDKQGISMTEAMRRFMRDGIQQFRDRQAEIRQRNYAA